MKHLKVLTVFLVFSFVLVLALNAQQQTDETVTCAVAGNEMKKSEVKVTHEYKGKTYYFCCAGCKKTFIKDPEKHIQGGPKEGHMHSHGETETNPEMDIKKDGEKVTCPVTGDEIMKSDAVSSIEYKGKTYYLCCPDCEKEFKENPEKYTKKKADIKEIYTCPMHPDVKSDKAGKCPKCGMNLVKKIMQKEHIHK